ncbi:MAG: GDSL-type esterase/lipase family protein [Clostridia bacterium]|nr:GDSL-type esterase/lipase family protein [Clostridia bacterium]
MKIVFIGDSITDCDRDRADVNSLGNGYVKILSDKLRPIYPDMDIQLLNKGVSGNEVCDVLARVNRDVIEEHPDACVLMIGINNVIHQFKIGKQLDLKQFERDYNELLDKIKEAGITLICLEPFLMPAPDKLRMRPLFNKELEIIHRIAVEKADEFVAYDEMFNGLADSIPYTQYSEDGVHPTHRGSRLIADTAIKAIRKHLM